MGIKSYVWDKTMVMMVGKGNGRRKEDGEGNERSEVEWREVEEWREEKVLEKKRRGKKT